MPKFSKRSIAILETCDERLQGLFLALVKRFDCKVVSGYRTPEAQTALFKKGRWFNERTMKWEIVNPLQIVTYKDGVLKKSKHNLDPSPAIDVVPYPLNWNDRERMYYFAGYVKATAYHLNIPIRWGGDWDDDTEVQDHKFVDLPHFELKEI